MAVTPTPVFPQTPKITPQNFVQGTDSAGTYKTIYTGGSNGSKVTGVSISSNDGSAAHLCTMVLTRSATDYIIGAINVPVNSGSASGANAIDALSTIPGLPLDSDGNPYLYLESGDTLRMTFATALTASTRLGVVTIGADF